jgi:hypothetical protein
MCDQDTGKMKGNTNGGLTVASISSFIFYQVGRSTLHFEVPVSRKGTFLKDWQNQL